MVTGMMIYITNNKRGDNKMLANQSNQSKLSYKQLSVT